MIYYLKIFLISMLPIVELRGAIPYGQIYNLPYISTLIVAILGNLILMPMMFMFSKKFLIWGSKIKGIDKLFLYILKKGHRVGEKLQNNSKYGVYLGLLLFVATPIPGTGAYTGVLAASILDLDFKKTMISLAGGVLGAGFIVSLVTFIIKMGIFN
jgi:hypothetical protein